MTLIKSLAALAVLLFVPVAQAQTADTTALTAQKAAMDRLARMRGIWSGPAVSHSPAGDIRMTQTERVGPFLDGTVTLVEGKAWPMAASASALSPPSPMTSLPRPIGWTVMPRAAPAVSS